MMLSKEYKVIEDMFDDIDDLKLDIYYFDYHHEFEEFDKDYI